MGDETVVAQGFLVVIKAEVVFDQVEDLLHHAGDVQRIVHLVVKLGVDQVQGDKSGFIFRQRGIQPLGDQGQRLQADGELGRIELLISHSNAFLISNPSAWRCRAKWMWSVSVM